MIFRQRVAFIQWAMSRHLWTYIFICLNRIQQAGWGCQSQLRSLMNYVCVSKNVCAQNADGLQEMAGSKTNPVLTATTTPVSKTGSNEVRARKPEFSGTTASYWYNTDAEKWNSTLIDLKVLVLHRLDLPISSFKLCSSCSTMPFLLSWNQWLMYR